MFGFLAQAASAANVANGIASSLVVLGTVSSVLESHHANEALEDYETTKERMHLVESKRQRQEVLKQARIKRAQVENVAAQTGTAGSAGAIGATQSIGTQTMANISFLDQTRGLSQQAGAFGKSAAKHGSRASTARAVGGIGMQFADFGTFIK